MSISAIRSAIATALQSSTLRAYANVVDNPQAPCVIVYPRRVEYYVAYDGSETLGFALEILTPSGMNDHGQTLLDALIDETGIAATIDANPTLSGAVKSARVIDMDPDSYGTLDLGNDPNRRFYRARLNLDIYV